MPAVFPSDLEIAQSAKMKHIKEMAASIGVNADDIEYYGKYKAKLPLKLCGHCQRVLIC